MTDKERVTFEPATPRGLAEAIEQNERARLYREAFEAMREALRLASIVLNQLDHDFAMWPPPARADVSLTTRRATMNAANVVGAALALADKVSR